MDCYENLMATGRVICPKPRRVGPSNFSNSVIPLRCHLRNGAEEFDSRAGAELLDLTLLNRAALAPKVSALSAFLHRGFMDVKRRNWFTLLTEYIQIIQHSNHPTSHQEGFQGEGCATGSSSPPFFFGSPPCRAQNPLAQDAHFRVQKHGPTSSSPSDTASLPSSHTRVKFGNKQAAVRIEGFDCQSRVTAMA